MDKLIEPVVNVYQAQLQTAKDLGELVLSSIEQIDRLALQAVKDALSEQRNNALTLVAAGDFDASAAALREALTPPNFERGAALARELQKTLSDTFAGMAGLCKAYVQEVDRNAIDVISTMQQGTKSAAGLGASGNATDFWNAAWQQAWQQMNAISEQYVRAVQPGAEVDKAAAVHPAKTSTATGTGSRARAM